LERQQNGVGEGGVYSKLGSSVNQVLGNIAKKVAVSSVMDLDNSGVSDRDGWGHGRRDSATGGSTTPQDRVVKRKTPTKELSVGEGTNAALRKVALVTTWRAAPDFGVLAASDRSDEDS
jgi:hypothetical protein